MFVQQVYFDFNKCTIPNRKVRRKENIPIRQRKIFQLEKGKYSNEKKENIPNRKKENIPIRKRKIFQLENRKYSNEKKKNIPISKGKYSN